jgi:hypothetical protein
MNWNQFSSEIVDDRPYIEYGPRFLTVTYARNSGLSPKDTVARHPSGSVCQSWEGNRYASEKAAPAGTINFLNDPEKALKLYTQWHIEVQCLRDHLAE